MIRPAVCLAALLTLTACQPPVRLLPAPALFLNGEHNLFAANANLDRSAQIQVFYATNRAALGSDGAPLYTVFPGGQLNLGTATLDIGGGGFEVATTTGAQRGSRSNRYGTNAAWLPADRR